MKNPIQMPSKSEMSNLRTMTKAAVTPITGATPNVTFTLVVAAVAERAYAKYVARGAQNGLDQEDWLAAEQEILAEGRFSSRVQRN